MWFPSSSYWPSILCKSFNNPESWISVQGFNIPNILKYHHFTLVWFEELMPFNLIVLSDNDYRFPVQSQYLSLVFRCALHRELKTTMSVKSGGFLFNISMGEKSPSFALLKLQNSGCWLHIQQHRLKLWRVANFQLYTPCFASFSWYVMHPYSFAITFLVFFHLLVVRHEFLVK